MSAYNIRPRQESDAIPREDLTAMASPMAERFNIAKLWQGSFVLAQWMGPTSIETVPGWASNASALAASFRVRVLDQSPVDQPHAAATSDLALPEQFSKPGPAARIKTIAQLGIPSVELNRILNTGSHLNALTQVQDSLRSVASGVQRWASFCDLINCPYFPHTSANVIKWRSLFHPGRAFSLYLSHLWKACHLLNIHPSRYNSSVGGVANGLENARGFGLKFENYIFKKLPIRPIAHESLESEDGRLFYIYYVFIHRLPSESLPAVWAYPHDSLLTRSRIPHQAAQGLRS